MITEIINENNEKVQIIINNRYIGLGKCGMTDGYEIKGKLTEFYRHDYAIILDDKLGYPCSVYIHSLQELK